MSQINFDTWKDRTGTYNRYGASAWVNFNGTGTVAIRDSKNVSSITDIGTGDYTINFSSAFLNTNYAALITWGGTASAYGGKVYDDATPRTVSALRVVTVTLAPAAVDVAQFACAVFGGN